MVQLDLGCLATHLSIFVAVSLSLSLNPHNSNRNTRIKLHRSLHQQYNTGNILIPVYSNSIE